MPSSVYFATRITARKMCARLCFILSKYGSCFRMVLVLFLLNRCVLCFCVRRRRPTTAYSSILISLFAYYECNTSFCLSKTKNTAIFLCEANWVWNTMCVRICIVLSVYNSTFYSPKCAGRIYFYCIFPAVCTNNEMAAAGRKKE